MSAAEPSKVDEQTRRRVRECNEAVEEAITALRRRIRNELEFDSDFGGEASLKIYFKNGSVATHFANSGEQKKPKKK